ncbi:MAG: fatty acid desaturase [Planctomycetales bacterium]|nr:fatty acid desaturase [Planctomycetales bacterium]
MSAVLMEPEVDSETPARLAETKSLDRQLLIASREFACEQRGASWWHFGTTLVVLAVCVGVAGWAEATWLRALGSLLSGLTLVRMFILYHDFQHQSILKGSRVAEGLLSLYGYLMLTPPSVWKRSHDHHHRHNSKLFGASIGSFPIMTTENYIAAPWLERLEYRLARSPLVIVFGYLAVFLFGMCVRPLLLDARRHWDAPLALLVHFGLIGSCLAFGGWLTTLLVFVLPTWIATSTGAYLFYVQHNFQGAKIRRCAEWSYTDAALKSSSYLEMGRVMHWLTGNIGYHHVHHLNAKIPFYRLPEAMAGLVPLQSPVRTSLRLRDIVGCLRLKLWDATEDRFVTFADARS